MALPAAAAALVWRELKDGARIPRVVCRVLIVSAAAALFMLPWTVKNAVLVGNPVAPFFNRLFPNPYVTVGWEDAYRKGQKHYAVTYPENRLVELMDAPLEVTVKGIRFQGLVGPIFLLAPLALLAWRHPARETVARRRGNLRHSLAFERGHKILRYPASFDQSTKAQIYLPPGQ